MSKEERKSLALNDLESSELLKLKLNININKTVGSDNKQHRILANN